MAETKTTTIEKGQNIHEAWGAQMCLDGWPYLLFDSNFVQCSNCCCHVVVVAFVTWAIAWPDFDINLLLSYSLRTRPVWKNFETPLALSIKSKMTSSTINVESFWPTKQILKRQIVKAIHHFTWLCRNNYTNVLKCSRIVGQCGCTKHPSTHFFDSYH